ncbi:MULTISPECIES: recombinase family protein [Psychrilyobacter]|uniref:Recombinase family protein n=1 Tax=Psychrilyobacter piezotolerans TaxID=2293438 RepID=A0ABX9KJA9_9FUSO|nr:MULTISPECIES: recombinase family protein [Psychrilyobacter]MCS5421730.1 recombinase family protein [Psychrilyobacter sp. S5]NDI77166.1 recombinase family protein [Psychrilyobacter piezotolerans]RDE64158.1 recombinase family protein [Psychrilyobacter sp. S5]REI42250.1 recombinase family protein [Psychrilyobacter piezotolerans]
MKIGYCRVSSIDQNIDHQINILKEEGCEKIYHEKISGKNADRLELKEMLSNLKKDDVVVSTSFNRVARNTKDLLEIVETIEEAGASFKSLKEDVGTKGAFGKFVVTMLGAVASFERELMLEKQKDGIARAKSLGKYKGKKRTFFIDDSLKKCFDMRLNKIITSKEALRMSGLKQNTYYKLFQEYKSDLIKKYEKEHGAAIPLFLKK